MPRRRKTKVHRFGDFSKTSDARVRFHDKNPIDDAYDEKPDDANTTKTNRPFLEGVLLRRNRKTV